MASPARTRTRTGACGARVSGLSCPTSVVLRTLRPGRSPGLLLRVAMDALSRGHLKVVRPHGTRSLHRAAEKLLDSIDGDRLRAAARRVLDEREDVGDAEALRSADDD